MEDQNQQAPASDGAEEQTQAPAEGGEAPAAKPEGEASAEGGHEHKGDDEDCGCA